MKSHYSKQWEEPQQAVSTMEPKVLFPLVEEFRKFFMARVGFEEVLQLSVKSCTVVTQTVPIS